ncbi:MAG: tRNA uracil 4-sulfurtransferase ThiI [Oscillospiraceae bacterium]
MKELIMAYQGEIALKGLNKITFENILSKNLRRRLEALGNFKVYRAQSTMYIEPLDDDADTDEAFIRVQKTFGLAGVSRAAICEKNFEDICKTALSYLNDRLSTAKTFRVTCKRSDKSFPMDSMEVARELGGVILDNFPNLTVDVRTPEVVVYVEVRDFAAYVHAEKQAAVGGMPVSTSGKAALMLSGGIDSPVAAYMMAKRGLYLMAVHFASPPYTSERAHQKVLDLAQKLTIYTGTMAVFTVPFTKVQEEIRDNAPDILFTVLMRRSMMRITNALAKKYGCEGIITGESLAQVASQTLQAIACTDAAQDLPILRPLIGMDKVEIMKISHAIDTYDISIEPFEDCCTIFTPPHPKTKPTLAEILEAENAMELAELERIAAEETQRVYVKL